jgi:MFS family permease
VHLPLRRVTLALLPRRFWWVLAFATVLTLARFSEAFLLLRATDLGLAVTWTPLIFIVMNLIYAASAYPFGHLADNVSRRQLLAWGIVFLITADLILARAGNLWWVGGGAALWGLHMGATQGILATLVADAAPAELRGTAFGIFNLIGGLALLAASIIAGGLWTAVGPALTFYAGAAFSSLALAGLLLSTLSN